MNFSQYQSQARRTVALFRGKGPEDITEEVRMALLSNAGLGLAGEAGECADILKKILHHGKRLDGETVDKLVLEVGDVLWYLSLLCDLLSVDMATAAEMNIEKLKKRYPNGFNHEDAAKRMDESAVAPGQKP